MSRRDDAGTGTCRSGMLQMTLTAVEGLAKLAPACHKHSMLQFSCVWAGRLKRKQADKSFSSLSCKLFPWGVTWDVPLVGEVETMVMDLSAKGLQLGGSWSTTARTHSLGSTKLKVRTRWPSHKLGLAKVANEQQRSVGRDTGHTLQLLCGRCLPRPPSPERPAACLPVCLAAAAELLPLSLVGGRMQLVGLPDGGTIFWCTDAEADGAPLLNLVAPAEACDNVAAHAARRPLLHISPTAGEGKLRVPLHLADEEGSTSRRPLPEEMRAPLTLVFHVKVTWEASGERQPAVFEQGVRLRASSSQEDTRQRPLTGSTTPAVETPSPPSRQSLGDWLDAAEASRANGGGSGTSTPVGSFTMARRQLDEVYAGPHPDS